MKKLAIISLLAVLAAAAAVYADISVISYPFTVIDAATGTVTVQWVDSGTGTTPAFSASLLYGVTQGVYTGSIAEDSPGLFSFNPEAEGMAGGAYYFRISTTAGGQAMSPEYRLFIGKATGLAVSFFEFSPNPFSPGLGPLQISYIPESVKNTSVKVTIKAYSMAGKHLATIADGAMRTVGAVNTDTWNGTDTRGYPCKNGRYIIQMEVQDSTGKRQYLNTVVLVK